MTTFVLDTDMMSLLQRGHPGVAAHFDHHQPYEVATTIISVEEQLSGTGKTTAPASSRLLRRYSGRGDGA